MRPLLALVALLAVAIGVAAITSRYHESNRPPSEEPETETSSDAPKKEATAQNDPNRAKMFDTVKEGAIQATLEIEGKGTMQLELYPKAAPKTVAHIVELAKSGFYEGVLVHRVEDGFVAQMGDPKSKTIKSEDLRGLTTAEVGQRYQLGMSGSGTTVPLEVKLPHLPNTIGMARSQDPDSGDSQFYINLKDNGDSLDGQYCVFGKIVSGQEVAPKIAIGDRIKRFSVP
jgi:peptidyl-prolyl cis-trans isomerase B (cyclophilin B)